MSHLPPPRVESPLVALQDAPNILSEFPMRVPLLRLYRRLNIPTARRECRICMGLITRTRYLVPVMTSEAAQSLQTGRVDMAWQGMLCEDKRGDPPRWKVEGACAAWKRQGPCRTGRPMRHTAYMLMQVGVLAQRRCQRLLPWGEGTGCCDLPPGLAGMLAYKV
jgi:hypothetical protein